MKNFFLGILLASTYLYFNFNNQCGSIPKYIKPTIPGILDNGHIIIKGYHIHHWIIFTFILIISIILNIWYNLDIFLIFGIALTFIYHGIGYDDCFILK